VSLTLLLVSTPFVAPTNAKPPVAAHAEDEQTAKTRDAKPRVGLENFDVRRDPETRAINGANIIASKAAPVDRTAALDAFVATVPASDADSVRVDLHDSGVPKTVANVEGFLTEARSGSPDAIARDFLAQNSELFGLSASEVHDLRVTMDNRDENTGVTYMKYEQMVDDIPVFDSEIGVTITAHGEVAIVNQGEILPGARVSAAPALTEEQGIAKAFEHCGVDVTPDQVRPALAKRSETGQFAYYENPLGEGREDVIFQKTVLNVGGEARLAYRAYVDKSDAEWYDTLVDADTGELLVRSNIVSDVQATVFTRSPGVNAGNSRVLVSLVPQFGVTDPWVGSATVTTGNNVDAYLDRDANDAPDATTTSSTGTNPGLTGGRADSAKGAPAGQFTFAYSASSDPTSQQANAVTNLFYFNNYMHDWMYSLGFTESARNFQTNNFGRGGVGNDRVKAEVQDGSGIDNANFATPADGSSGRMQQYIFDLSFPSRDSDLDGDVVLHEYGHGVSNRLIGNGSGLGGTQSGAMGEGWSDYWACSNYNDGAVGEYSVNDASGIRRAVYSVPADPVHDSYADVGNSGFEVHDDGEIWAAALWDLLQTLGKTKTDKIVLDGMKNTVTSPSMVSARTGIVTACQTDFPGDVCTVWTVFARHGLGNSASGNDGTTHNAAFDLPASCGGTGCSSSTTTIASGQSRTGSLATTDCTTTAGNSNAGAFYDTFTFSGTSGQQVTITMSSSAFDCFLRLYNPSGTQVAFDDDSNGGTNSKIVYTLAASGTFKIATTSYDPGSTGSYTVTFSATGGGGGVTVLSEGAESGAPGWTVSTNVSGNNWVINGSAAHSGLKRFRSNNATSTYVNNLDQSLYSPVFSLAGRSSATLTFYYKHGTESGYDFFNVEFSSDGGTTWTVLKHSSGLSSGWTAWAPQASYTLPVGSSNCKIRFRLTTDFSVTDYGAAVDDILVTAN
jgi:Zn-dependent metalloprotease